MLKHAAAGARHRWPILVLSLVSVSALALSAFTLLASADKGRNLASVSSTVSNVATGKADAVDELAGACTCAPYFHDMPFMTKTFKLGGTASRPVIVLFQSELSTGTPGSRVETRLTIDGVVQPGPGATVILSTLPSDALTGFVETHGFNFISNPLAPGTHTATIQWRDSGEGPWYASRRSLIILHK
jgi:hypothetical protein